MSFLFREIKASSFALFFVFAFFSPSSYQSSAMAQDGLGSDTTECAILNAENWDEYVPSGKEVDAIYGDIVLRNEHIVAIIANPIRTRNANMTVRNIGGCVIDLTSRKTPNDQLSCFYPGGDRVVYRSGSEGVNVFEVGVGVGGSADEKAVGISELPCKAGSLHLQIEGRTIKGNLPATVTYQLNAGDRFLRIKSTIRNTSEEKVEFELVDMIRADGTFANRMFDDDRMIGYYDQWFRQAYGILTPFDLQATIKNKSRTKTDRKQIWAYKEGESTSKTIESGESESWERMLFPAKDWWELEVVSRDIAEVSRRANNKLAKPDPRKSATFIVQDNSGRRVEDAKVVILQGEETVALARTGESGELTKLLDEGKYKVAVAASGRKDVVFLLAVTNEGFKEPIVATMSSLGTIVATITDDKGQPIACKVSFDGVEGTKSPHFGPESRAVAMVNARYSANGSFEQKLGPGKYEAIVSHGTEYDAKVVPITVTENETTKLEVALKHSVETPGWISTEYHSHSSESGDNTSDQLGRVLNLLAEQIDFAPCTEHNRVDTYLPHLESLHAVNLMATCPGMELTGAPLPQNHQNAFPLIMRPRTQDGGGPTTHSNPVVQIERLKYWDNKSEKLVQMNHPNLMSVYADQDSNNEADAGFSKMFDYVDVIEVHPLTSILSPPTELPPPGKRGNTIFQWLQLLNQGYRIPGVINADAHYNFHGSGYYRNYVMSSTDDPAKIDTMEIVRNSKAGRVIMSSGPYLSVQAEGQSLDGDSVVKGEVGDDVALKKDTVKLNIKVQCPNWIDIDLVQVVVNGRLEESLRFTRKDTPKRFQSGTIKFDQSVSVPLKEDAHLIVIAHGGSQTLGRIFGPRQGTKDPIAVSNPIYIDVDGGGFKANQDRLDAPFLMPVR